MADERKYSDVELREILQRALEKQSLELGTAGISHAELLAIGEQVGVSPAAMADAALEVSRLRLDADAKRALKSRRQKWLAGHAALFALVNGLLFTVNYLTTPGEWWVLFSVFFWGLALAAHAAVTTAFGASPSPSALERERRKLQAASPRLRIDATAAGIEATAEEGSQSEAEENGARSARLNS